MSFNCIYDSKERTLSFPGLNQVFQCNLGPEIGNRVNGSNLFPLLQQEAEPIINTDCNSSSNSNGYSFNSRDPKETEETKSQLSIGMPQSHSYPTETETRNQLPNSQSFQNKTNKTTVSCEEMIYNGNCDATNFHGGNMIYNGKGGAVYKVRQKGSYYGNLMVPNNKQPINSLIPSTQPFNQSANLNQMNQMTFEGEDRKPSYYVPNPNNYFNFMVPNNRQPINSLIPSTQPFNQSANLNQMNQMTFGGEDDDDPNTNNFINPIPSNESHFGGIFPQNDNHGLERIYKIGYNLINSILNTPLRRPSSQYYVLLDDIKEFIQTKSNQPYIRWEDLKKIWKTTSNYKVWRRFLKDEEEGALQWVNDHKHKDNSTATAHKNAQTIVLNYFRYVLKQIKILKEDHNFLNTLEFDKTDGSLLDNSVKGLPRRNWKYYQCWKYHQDWLKNH